MKPLSSIKRAAFIALHTAFGWVVGVLLLASLVVGAAAILLWPLFSFASWYKSLLIGASSTHLLLALAMFIGMQSMQIFISYKDENGRRWSLMTKEFLGFMSKVSLKLLIFAIGVIFAVWHEGNLFDAYSLIPMATGLVLVPMLLAPYTQSTGYGSRKIVSAEELDYVIYGGSRTKERSTPSSNDDSPSRDLLEVVHPALNFSGVHGYADLKARLLEAANPVFPKKGTHRADNVRNGILLNGDPGNGKTFIAQALAGELGVKFLTMDYGKVVSQWVGETPRNIASAFDQARRNAPCVLFIDEIDSFIINRDGGGQQTAEAANIVNLLLTELVNIRRHPVLVVAATNRLNKLDPAAIREGRFDYKIEVPNPDEEARIGLLLAGLRKHAKGVALDEAAVRSAAHRWNGFSVKRIMAVGEEMPAYLREHPASSIGYEQLTGALRRIQGRKGKVPADTKTLDQLVLPEQTRTAVDLVASRIADPMRIERLGGSLPSGVLFYGPSGTGKTAVARALAKKTGWAFLSVAGPDLLRDADAMDKLYAEAKDLRPVLIFIDEADDILRDRSISNASALTNKLLTIMDGADGKVKDVVFIAATNNPDQIDPAMLRAGRFTEKVPFFAADEASAKTIVQQWLAGRKIALAQGVSPLLLAKMLDGQSPANIEGVLQYALNLAISDSKDDTVVVSLDHVGRSMAVVAPE